MFEEYACGCIGFVVDGTSPDIKDHIVWCIYACDDDSSRIKAPHQRNELAERSSRKLDAEELDELMLGFSRLFSDGYKLRTIKLALR